MSDKISLKTQNMPFIILFLAWSITIYILFLNGYSNFWNDMVLIFSGVNTKDGFFAVISPLISFVLLNIIDSDLKAIIIFWKVKNPLPGTRSFSEIGSRDPRVDMNVIKSMLGYIPVDPIEQNRIWYRIFKQVDKAITVNSSYKNFLLARDLATVAFLFLIFTPWSIQFLKNDFDMTLIYTLIWLFHYLILCKVAQNAGERFVSNVLAEYCCKERPDEKLNR